MATMAATTTSQRGMAEQRDSMEVGVDRVLFWSCGMATASAATIQTKLANRHVNSGESVSAYSLGVNLRSVGCRWGQSTSHLDKATTL